MVTHALQSTPIYAQHTQRRIRLVLEAVENAMRSPKSEEEHCPPYPFNQIIIKDKRSQRSFLLPGENQWVLKKAVWTHWVRRGNHGSRLDGLWIVGGGAGPHRETEGKNPDVKQDGPAY